MEKLSVILFLLFFSFSGEVLASPVPERYRASTAKSVVETQVEEEAEVYQYVETTVNGQTVRKESTQPGEVKVSVKDGKTETKITTSPSPSLAPSPIATYEATPVPQEEVRREIQQFGIIAFCIFFELGSFLSKFGGKEHSKN